MTRFSRLAAAPALAGALVLASAVAGAGFLPAAVAHDAVVGSTPEDGAVLDAAPDRIELEFSANPRDTFNTVALSRDGEVLVSDETPEIEGNLISVDIPDDVDMTDGEYTVGFRITSSDGHPT
ncbi:MAG: copper resistance protein CopC [Corynebacterium variabile]|uniref:copper resistance CopC family protein n=1 Tax=Corynebacterium variabile TaxID=1727 RepID=UPI002648235A|nr:copper resistance CopC family protein [Corynebacterium variabile]MDN6536295.1 copper resistance protein CopC [Corynebacterium variabile]